MLGVGDGSVQGDGGPVPGGGVVQGVGEVLWPLTVDGGEGGRCCPGGRCCDL